MPLTWTGTLAALPMKATLTSPLPSCTGRTSPRSSTCSAAAVALSLAMRVMSARLPSLIVAVTSSWAYSLGLAMRIVLGSTAMAATVSPGTRVSTLRSCLAVARTLSSAITSLAARALSAASGTLTNSFAILPVAASIRRTRPSWPAAATCRPSGLKLTVNTPQGRAVLASSLTSRVTQSSSSLPLPLTVSTIFFTASGIALS